MSFVSHSRTVTVNDDNDEANNNDTTNGPASIAAVVLRLARSESGSSRKRGRSPTGAAAEADPSSSSSSRSNEGGRGGILERPRTDSEPPTLEPYVPALVPEIIANVDDARIPFERDSDLTDDEKAAKHQRGLAIRQATAAQFYAGRRWSGSRSMSCWRTSGWASP